MTVQRSENHHGIRNTIFVGVPLVAAGIFGYINRATIVDVLTLPRNPQAGTASQPDLSVSAQFTAIAEQSRATNATAEARYNNLASERDQLATWVAEAQATLNTNRVPVETPQPASATLVERQRIWADQWPTSPDQAAAKFGGEASQWQRNPEWPDTRTIDNPSLGISGYMNREWRPTNSKDLPFNWPKTPKEAAEYLFPGQNLDPRFIQAAWIDPITGLITGWHLSEDHSIIDGSKTDLTLMLRRGQVAEGYTVKGTLDPGDDRNWVAFGGFETDDEVVAGLGIQLPEGQGMTVWVPGTDPNAIALRMELFVAGDTPFYQGQNGEQLGPIPIGFTPLYPAP